MERVNLYPFKSDFIVTYFKSTFSENKNSILVRNILKMTNGINIDILSYLSNTNIYFDNQLAPSSVDIHNVLITGFPSVTR